MYQAATGTSGACRLYGIEAINNGLYSLVAINSFSNCYYYTTVYNHISLAEVANDCELIAAIDETGINIIMGPGTINRLFYYTPNVLTEIEFYNELDYSTVNTIHTNKYNSDLIHIFARIGTSIYISRFEKVDYSGNGKFGPFYWHKMSFDLGVAITSVSDFDVAVDGTFMALINACCFGAEHRVWRGTIVSSCNGIVMGDSNVCSKHGVCHNTKCLCDVYYYGEFCSVTTCNGVFSNDTSTVCSGHGICETYDTCKCSAGQGWIGEKCNISSHGDIVLNSIGGLLDKVSVANSGYFMGIQGTTRYTHDGSSYVAGAGAWVGVSVSDDTNIFYALLNGATGLTKPRGIESINNAAYTMVVATSFVDCYWFLTPTYYLITTPPLDNSQCNLIAVIDETGINTIAGSTLTNRLYHWTPNIATEIEFYNELDYSTVITIHTNKYNNDLVHIFARIGTSIYISRFEKVDYTGNGKFGPFYWHEMKFNVDGIWTSIDSMADFDVGVDGTFMVLINNGVATVKEVYRGTIISYCSGIEMGDSSVCSRHGVCLNSQCFCDINYFGENCNITTCNDILSNQTNSVCSGHGTCGEFEVCNCYVNWFGDDCNITFCNGILSNETNNVCNGHGTCNDDECECDENYYGEDCNITICDGIFSNLSKICSNKGICWPHEICQCEDNYHGDSCNITECNGVMNNLTGIICRGHGTCWPFEKCTCEPATEYFGFDCNETICNDLFSNETDVCTNHGVCHFFETCQCDDHYYGPDCNVTKCNNVMSNLTEVCSDHGVCLLFEKCQCDDNYYGPNCNITKCNDILSNVTEVCTNHGFCNVFEECQCDDDYYGPDCNVTTCNDVFSNKTEVCFDHGDCFFFETCQCDDNYYGHDCNITKCNDILSNITSVCTDHGVCHVFEECQCDDDYFGPDCNVTKCNDILSNETEVCTDHGVCLFFETCQCDDDYYGPDCNVTTCNDLFSNNTLVCSDHGECYVFEDCQCDDNYYGPNCNVTKCNDILSNVTEVCTDHGFCHVFETCQCDDDYYGPDCNITKCNDILSNETNICSTHGVCLFFETCQCDDNYYGPDCNVTKCNDILSNLTEVCSNRGFCNVFETCQCDDNYYGPDCNITKCNDILSNMTEVCTGHGICNVFETCQCDDDYYGPDCNVTTCNDIFSNKTDVCFNHGVCLFFETCQCDDYYYGHDCNVTKCNDILSNVTEVCTDHGVCHIFEECQCDDDYHGPDCNITKCSDIYSNKTVVCTNHGVCLFFETCQCDDNYYGHDCNITKCNDIFSNRTEVCTDHGFCNVFETCQCDDNYYGNDCNITKCNDILSNMTEVCTNHGVCHFFETCQCDDNYYGPDCNVTKCNDLFSNNTLVCSDRGECYVFEDCQCDDNYYGPNCNITKCNDILSNMTDVCTNHGFCNVFETCQCDNNYYGIDCNITTCDSTYSNLTTVCNGRGTCTDFEDCQCYTPVSYSDCPIIAVGERGNNGKTITCYCTAASSGSGSVWGTSPFTDDSKVCRAAKFLGLLDVSDEGNINIIIAAGESSYSSGTANGVTTSPYGAYSGSFLLEDCNCNHQYMYEGDYCQFQYCNGILSNESGICNNHGQCTDYNDCECDDYYFGKNCDVTICEGVFSNETVCSNHGTCEVYEIGCVCDSPYMGVECSKYSNFHFIKGSFVGGLVYNGSLVCDDENSYPPPRTRSVSFSFSNHETYTFGGYGKDNFTNSGKFNDVWRFSLDEKWCFVSGSNQVNVSQNIVIEKQVFDLNNQISSRSSHSGFSSLFSFLVFGGELVDGSNTNELWEFLILSQNKYQWRMLFQHNESITSNQQPQKRKGHCMAKIDDFQAYIFGGMGTDTIYLNDLWIYNSLTNTFQNLYSNDSSIEYNSQQQSSFSGIYDSMIPLSNEYDSPFHRSYSICWVSQTFNFFIFGGTLSDGVSTSDVWMFNTTSHLKWKYIKGGTSSSNKGSDMNMISTYYDFDSTNLPSARSGSIFFFNQEQFSGLAEEIMFFGGINDQIGASWADVWSFSNILMQFKFVNESIPGMNTLSTSDYQIASRGHASGVMTRSKKMLILFGELIV